MEFVPLLNGFFALIALGAAAYSGRSWPIGVRKVVDNLSERVVAAESNVEALQSKWLTAQADFEAEREAIEGVLSSIETKRRRIAASESRAKNGAAQPQSPEEQRLQLLRMAREQGYQV